MIYKEQLNNTLCTYVPFNVLKCLLFYDVIAANECTGDPCKNNGKCTVLLNTYNCSCVDGYTGVNCETNIDDCDPDPCENEGTCNDLVNTYNCSCVDGYTGDNCEMNIDDCDPNPCENEETCNDLVNNYTCMCTEDFEGRNCIIYIGRCPANYMTGKLSYVHIYT